MNDDEYVETIQNKISVIPDFPKEIVEKLLKVRSVVNERRKSKIETKINKMVDRAYDRFVIDNKNPILSYPSEYESQGDIQIGYTCAGDQTLHPYYLTRVNLTENIFGVGRAGSGKTTFIIFFVDQLESAGIKYTIIDWKNDYTFLAKKYPDTYLLKYNHIAYNPWTNIPPGMDRKLWWFIVLDVIAHSTGLYVATPSHILEALEEIYQTNNGRINCKDLYQYLKSQNETKRREEYNSTALNRLFLLNELLDPVINVDYGFDLEELFRQKCIIQMAPLHQAVSSFLFNVLALWEYYRRLYKNVRADWNSTPVNYFLANFHIFIMDEAHLTQYSGQEHKDATIFSPPPLSMFFSQSRELGLATCAFTQFPNMVQSTFKANAGTRVIGNLVETDMRKDLAASLGLDEDDEKLLGKLDKGMWIVNVAGRTKKPFLMKTPMVEKPIVAEQEVVDSKFLSKLKMKKQEIESRMFLEDVDKKESKHDSNIPLIPDNAWRLLENVFKSPLQFQKKRAKTLGFSGRKITSVRDLLLEKGLITTESFQVNDYKKTFYILTKNALKHFNTLKESKEDKKKIGFHAFLGSSSAGFEHRYFQLCLKMQHEELGWKVKIEPKFANGRVPDLFTELDGKRKIIELEFSTTDIENKLSILEYCDELVLLYKEASHALFAKSKLEKMKDIPKEKITVGLVNDYTKLLNEIIRNNTRIEPEKGVKGTEIEGFRPKDILDWKSDGNGAENN